MDLWNPPDPGSGGGAGGPEVSVGRGRLRGSAVLPQPGGRRRALGCVLLAAGGDPSSLRSARWTRRSRLSWRNTCLTSTGGRGVGVLGSGGGDTPETRAGVFSSVRLFSGSSVEAIVSSLKADGSSFATKQAEV